MNSAYSLSRDKFFILWLETEKGREKACELFNSFFPAPLSAPMLGTGDCSDAVRHTLDFCTHLRDTFEKDRLHDDIMGCLMSLSRRSRTVALRILDKVEYDIPRLYDYLTADDFDCCFLRGVGVKTAPEVKSWCDRVVSLIERSSELLP